MIDDLNKIYELALSVEPKDYTSGNIKFERYVKAASPQVVTRLINRLQAAESELSAMRAELDKMKEQVPDIEKILGKLNHVLKMNRDVMTGTGVVYIEEVCRMLSPTPTSDEAKS